MAPVSSLIFMEAHNCMWEACTLAKQTSLKRHPYNPTGINDICMVYIHTFIIFVIKSSKTEPRVGDAVRIREFSQKIRIVATIHILSKCEYTRHK